MRRTVIDVAGALMGGAARYLTALDGFLQQSVDARDVRVIGRGRRLGATWLLRRETARLRASRMVASNNIAFVSGRPSVVVLRNALHFLTAQETSDVGLGSSRVTATAWLVRCRLRHADAIVVPSRSMRERVLHRCPEVAERTVVLNHPVAALGTRARQAHDRFRLLCPVLDAPYKSLSGRLALLASEVARSDQFELRVTAEPDRVFAAHGVVSLGALGPTALEHELSCADAIVFPLTLESFGYPMAEGRLRRIPVIAPSGDLSTEIAGDAHVPCDFDDVDSIRRALGTASELALPPLPANPFDPRAYFTRLLWGTLGAAPRS